MILPAVYRDGDRNVGFAVWNQLRVGAGLATTCIARSEGVCEIRKKCKTIIIIIFFVIVIVNK